MWHDATRHAKYTNAQSTHLRWKAADGKSKQIGNCWNSMDCCVPRFPLASSAHLNIKMQAQLQGIAGKPQKVRCSINCQDPGQSKGIEAWYPQKQFSKRDTWAVS